MRKMFEHPNNIMLYKERTEFEEYGHAKAGLRVCQICGAMYYKKSWHHAFELDFEVLSTTKKFAITECPACKMIEKHRYEGEIIIENIPKQIISDLSYMIHAYIKRAYTDDCQHRLVGLHKKDSKTWIIRVTENQLANKLAKKIQDAFSKVDVKVSYSKEPNDLERVKVKFQPVLSLSHF